MFEKLIDAICRLATAYEKEVARRVIADNHWQAKDSTESASCECKNVKATVEAVKEKYPAPTPVEPEVVTQETDEGETEPSSEERLTEIGQARRIATDYGISFTNKTRLTTLLNKIEAHEAKINAEVPPEGSPVGAPEAADDKNILGEPLTKKAPQEEVEEDEEPTEELVREKAKLLIDKLGGPLKAHKKVVAVSQGAVGFSRVSDMKDAFKNDPDALKECYAKVIAAFNLELEV